MRFSTVAELPDPRLFINYWRLKEGNIALIYVTTTSSLSLND